MDYSDEKKEKLNRLEKKLYSRNAPDIIDEGISKFGTKIDEETVTNPKVGWDEVRTNSFDELAARMSKVAQNKHTFVNKIFKASIVFFILAALIAVFVFLGGGNLVSSKNVDITVVGPISVPGGQEVAFDINIVNNNNTDLNSASLLIEYPDGTRSSSDLSKELDRERFSIESIKSGEAYRQNIKVTFFGEKESIKQTKISLEYRVENSSALFYKEKVHEVSISSAPVIITPTYPKEVNSNQDISFDIEVASNSKDSMGNFLMTVEYPFGFVFRDSSPKASFGNNIWSFSNLKSGEKRKISIKGSVVGQNNEEKVFRISAGTANENDERVIAVPLLELTESILVKKPFIGLDFSIEGKDGEVALKGGNSATAELVVRNNLPSRVFNTSVEVSFKGGAFDQLSVTPDSGGFFQSSNNTILWDKRTVVEFNDMAPGSERRLTFRFSPLVYSRIAQGVKPEIEISVKAKGERILDSGSVEPISASETRKVVLATDINLSSKVVRSVGNIENSGPVPPRVNIPTTYTVVWSVVNSFNQVSNVEVRATLPSYVKWTDQHAPSSESISFNPVTDQVVWNTGSVLPNTGFGTTKKEVYFQLEFLPSSSQVGDSPIIMSGASLSGIDKVTGARVEFTAGPLNTNFSGDPSFKNGNDIVVQ